VSGSQQPTLGGRPPMAGGIGGTSKSRNEETEKLSKFDKLMSLVKRNGIWPASGDYESFFCIFKLSFQKAKLSFVVLWSTLQTSTRSLKTFEAKSKLLISFLLSLLSVN